MDSENHIVVCGQSIHTLQYNISIITGVMIKREMKGDETRHAKEVRTTGFIGVVQSFKKYLYLLHT